MRLEHLRVQRSRRSFHFTQAHRLAKRFNPIFVENLNITGMVKNHSLAKSISDASWGQFLRILSHAAESAHGAVIGVEDRDVVSARIIRERGLGRPVGEDAGSNRHPMIREAAAL